MNKKNKKMVFLIFVAILLLGIGDTSLAGYTYWYASVNSNWFDAENWYEGMMPTSSDWAFIRGTGPEPNIISGNDAVAGIIAVAPGWDGPTNSISVSGGNLTVTDNIIIGYGTNTTGTFNLNSGSVTTGSGGSNSWVQVGYGQNSTGILNINGGTLTTGTLGLPNWYGATALAGYVYLNGGIINCSTNLVIKEDSFIDITGGTLILDSDDVGEIEGYVANCRIKAYGGRGNVDIDTNINPGKITVTASANLGKAWNPNLDNNGTAHTLTPTLIWAPGDYVQEVNAHEIYFGSVFESVRDASVDNPLDVYRGAQNWDANTYSPGLLELNTTYYWRIDEVNENHVDERWRGDVWKFSVGSGMAIKPKPAITATSVEPNIVLNWQPSPYANSHDVYFGTDFDDVNNGANSLPIGSSVYKGNQLAEANSYDPCGLNFGQLYYWRVDEITDTGIVKGAIWNFTVAENIVDDFESYDDTGNLLAKWIDGSSNATGSTISLYTLGNAMQFEYDNSSNPWYSEAELAFSTPQDWGGVVSKAISLRFRGLPNNGNEQIYLLLSDGDANGAVKLDDVNAAREDAWQIWDIDLEEFGNQEVNLANIEKLAIGFGDRDNPQAGGSGTVYFDDIILYPARCLTIYQSGLDLNNDCVIDYQDLSVIGQDWLMSDYNVIAVEPNDNRLLVHYKFDEISGTIANDETGSYNATVDANGADAWDPCGYDGGCLYFDGTFSVSIPSGAFAAVDEELTVSMWINADVNTMLDRLAKVQFRTGPDGEDYDRLNWSIDDANEHSGQWNHYVFVKHAGQGLMRIYHNGEIAAQNLDAFGVLDGLAAGITKIGVNEDGVGHYRGKIDDLRIYDYALSQQEVAYLTLGNTGQLHQPLEPVFSIYDLVKDGRINFIDYSVLAEAWLTNSLWP